MLSFSAHSLSFRYREEVREMFQHAYNRSLQLESALSVISFFSIGNSSPVCLFLSYLEHAYPYDELRPLSCDGVDTWGSYSLTLIGVHSTLVPELFNTS